MSVEDTGLGSLDGLNAESQDATADATVSFETAAEVDSANSSDAQPGDDAPSDLLSVIQRVAEPKTADAEASPAEEDGHQTEDSETDPAEATSEQPQGKEGEEDFSDVPFHNHPRFKKLVAQRNELRQKAEAFEADATQFRQVQDFMRTNALSAEEVAEGLTVMALMKHSPQEAWARLKPTVQNLMTAAGEVLPEDLGQRVRKGELPRDAALEMSRLRARQEAERARQQMAAQQARARQQAQTGQALRDSAARWEAQVRGRDPDFDVKLEPLRREIAWLQRSEGVPSDPSGVQAQLQRAYEAVSKQMAPRQPRPAVKPVTGGRGQATTKAEPSSMIDLIRSQRSA